MNEEAAFLRAICEQPDDDTPRLVFADWLSEQGGPVNTAWANGIRAQVWLARGATDAAFAQQSKVFESQYGLHKVRERLGVPVGIRVREWARGFPTYVEEPYRELRPAWRRIAGRVPIQRLYFFEATARNVADFVKWPALAALRELTIGARWEAPLPDAVSPVAGCSALRGLETLALTYVLVTNATVTAVLDAPHLAGLKRLKLQPGYNADPLSPDVEARLRERFGPGAIDDAIPF